MELRPGERYIRLNPVHWAEERVIMNPQWVEKLTNEWLQSVQGRRQVDNVVRALSGVPSLRPPPPPSDTNAGYNPTLDENRPQELGPYLT